MSIGNEVITKSSPFGLLGDNTIEWTYLESAYHLRVLLVPEREGGFSVHALCLPGVISQGETQEEALRNIEEAFRGVAQEYRASGSAIPWSDVVVEDAPKEATEKLLLIENV